MVFIGILKTKVGINVITTTNGNNVKIKASSLSPFGKMNGGIKGILSSLYLLIS